MLVGHAVLSAPGWAFNQSPRRHKFVGLARWGHRALPAAVIRKLFLAIVL